MPQRTSGTMHEARSLLERAEAAQCCAAPETDSLQAVMRGMARQGELVRPCRQLYARPDYWSALNARQRHLHVMRGLQKRHPTWVFCGVSAALAWGLDVSYWSLGRIHLICERTGRHHDEVLAWHRTYPAMGPREKWLASVNDLHATSLEQTVTDCLRMLDFANGLAVADAALRRTGRKRRWLEELARKNSGQGLRGIQQMRLTAGHADGRAENGGESYARAVMLELGFQAPELQVSFEDPLSGAVRRVDFLWRNEEGALVVGELDGREKYVTPEMTQGRKMVDVFADERLRESRLTAHAQVMRFSFGDVMHRERLERILRLYRIPRVCAADSFDVRPRTLRLADELNRRRL